MPTQKGQPRTPAQKAALAKAQKASAAKRSAAARASGNNAASGNPRPAKEAADRSTKPDSGLQKTLAGVKVTKRTGESNHEYMKRVNAALYRAERKLGLKADLEWAARTYGGKPADYSRNANGDLVNRVV